MSHALEQTKAAGIGVICKSASSTPHFLLARVQFSTCFPICLSRIPLAASLNMCPVDCVGKAVEILCITMQSIAEWMLELLESATSWGCLLLQKELWPSCTSMCGLLARRAAKNRWKISEKGIFCSVPSIFCKASRISRFSRSNEGLRGVMFHTLFIVWCVQESPGLPAMFFFRQSLVLPVRVSNVTWCWGWLLGLCRIYPSSFTMLYPFLFQDLFQNQALGSANHETHLLNHVFPPKRIALGPLQCLGHEGAMRISDDIFLIHRFPKSLGHQDLKLVEGKRSGSWRTSTTWLWPANGFLYNCIGYIGLWTVSHLWYSNTFAFSSLQGMRQRIPRNQCMSLLDGINTQDIQRTPQGTLRPGEKSQLNLTFHPEWCYTYRIKNSLFHITKA